MHTPKFLKSVLLIICLFVFPSFFVGGAYGTPLSVSSNGRYFTDGSGKAIYLTGSHNWNSLLDSGAVDVSSGSASVGPLEVLSDNAWNTLLDIVQTQNHNFIRMWIFEGWVYAQGWAAADYYEPLPYARTGIDNALDDKPKFDLSQLNQAYFDRLLSRVAAANDKGIYVSIMLFQGFGLDTPETWRGHPFNSENNINGINGDLNGDGIGNEIQTLQNSDFLAIQENYVKKVIDTVNHFDNILYEISNQSASDSVDWQYHMVDFIHDYERTKPKRHPVGITVMGQESNSALFNSTAEWVSPTFPAPVDSDPPAADGTKVVLLDTDHLAAEVGSQAWVWKSFLRGYNPLYMDNLLSGYLQKDRTRVAMGQTLVYANKINLVAMIPRSDLSSTAHCLANPGNEYLVYQPTAGTIFSVNVSAGTYNYEWFDPSSGSIPSTGRITVSSDNHDFTPPFTGDAVVYLSAAPGGLAGDLNISVFPSKNDFGNVTAATSSAAQTFIVSNGGAADLSLGTIEIAGTNASEFVILYDSCSGKTLKDYLSSPNLSSSCTVQVVFSPESGGAKTANLSIPSDIPTLNVPLSGWGVIPMQSYSIWNDTANPFIESANDPNPIELGVKFRSDVNGYITGLRFYKGTDNTGTHIGNLWTGTGELLATVTFTNETVDPGWQTVALPNPVPITAYTTYIASYHTNAGHYAVNPWYFSFYHATAGNPLQSLRDGLDGPDGLYQYGPGGFPNQTVNSNNYWVDIVFAVNSGAVDHITISPSSAIITAGGNQSYTVQALDASNNSLGDVTGSTAFSIAPDGFCTKGTCTATVAGSHLVTVTNSERTATATLTVNGRAVDHITISPSSATITAGGNQSYTVQAFDASNNSLGDVTASTAFSIAPNGSCTGAVCTATVASSHTITATYSGKTATATLAVNAGPLDHITISPASATINTGGSQSYTAASFDQYSNSLGDVTVSTAFSIAPDGSCTGAVCTATVAGSHTITATYSGKTATATLQVSAASTIWSNTATPTYASVSDTKAVELGVKFRSDV
ncbi:MAG TPA: DUF4082 domain-containing protein, partial [Thermodesulfovibrionales bacterium]|nr:DUF4082 domain-containing protein [Thermodesulfovibrionales bacterium]